MKISLPKILFVLLIIGLVYYCLGLRQYPKDTKDDEGIRKDYWEKQNPTTTYETGSYEVVNGKIQLRNEGKTEDN